MQKKFARVVDFAVADVVQRCAAQPFHEGILQGTGGGATDAF